ncbi:hypothetical protein SCA6_000974 [Theobroma cacao]
MLVMIVFLMPITVLEQRWKTTTISSHGKEEGTSKEYDNSEITFRILWGHCSRIMILQIRYSKAEIERIFIHDPHEYNSKFSHPWKRKGNRIRSFASSFLIMKPGHSERLNANSV